MNVIKLDKFFAYLQKALLGAVMCALFSCAQNAYNVYDTKSYTIKMDLRGIQESEAKQVLDAYFSTYQYKYSENHHVYFIPCPVANKCQKHRYTMVWIWDDEAGQQCSKGVDIYQNNEQFDFKPENTRCIN